MKGKLDAPASTSFTSHPSNAHFFRSTPGACSQAIKPQSNGSRNYSLPDVSSTFKGKIIMSLRSKKRLFCAQT